VVNDGTGDRAQDERTFGTVGVEGLLLT
jgi:hypothetical protein